jgi:hypothetical protein
LRHHQPVSLLHRHPVRPCRDDGGSAPGGSGDAIGKGIYTSSTRGALN